MKNIQFKILLYLLLLNGVTVFGQFQFTANDTNYYEIVNRFYSDPLNLDTNIEDGTLTHFIRWQEFWRGRIGPSGSFRRVSTIMHNYINNISATSTLRLNYHDNWEPLGPFGRPQAGSFSSQNSRGNGQMRRLAFDPDDPNLIYSCALIGGLWKGEDPGTGLFNWSPLSDNTSPMGCGDVWVEKFIDINSVSHKLIFISLGPGEGGYDRMGLGIYRSKDGGPFIAVNQGLQTSSDFFHISRILGHPTNPDIIFAATDIGVFKTINATSTCSWELVFSGTNEFFRGLAFKPDSPSVVYASGKDVYKSTSDGNSGTFNSIGSTAFIAEFGSLPVRVNIEVTPESGFENELFATFIVIEDDIPNQYVWRFDGTTWTNLGQIGSIAGNFPDRLPLAVSPSNHNTFFTGSDLVYRGTFDGSNRIIENIGGNYFTGMVHPDIHDLKLDPSNNLLVACDGGIYKSTNPFVTTPTFIDVSNGLQTNLIMGMATSSSHPDIIVAGAWDCGTMYTDNATQIPNSYAAEFGGDGGQCNIDNNDNIYFTFIPGGGSPSPFYYTNNNFTSMSSFSRDPEGWMTTLFHHEIGPISQQLYSVTNNIWRYDPALTNPWVRISHIHSDYPNIFSLSGTPCGVLISSIGIAPSDENIIYAANFPLPPCTTSHMFKTITNGGAFGICNNGSAPCWILINIPSFITETISDIVVDPDNPEHLYFTCKGYSINQKVFESVDGGISWINISSGIDESIPVNCIVYEKGSNGGIYIGTDIGVYYKNNSMSSWTPYFDDVFPHCIVNDLEINYIINKIRAGTYGRGIWQSPLSCPTDLNLTLSGIISIDQFKEAENNISSIETTNNVNNTYRAGLSIEMNPGFEATASTSKKFYAYIHACNHPGNSFRKNKPLLLESKVLEKDINSKIIKVYPNPTNGNFTVSFSEYSNTPNKILISDITGKTVWSDENVEAKEKRIHLENVSKGIYILKINLNEHIYCYKISIF